MATRITTQGVLYINGKQVEKTYSNLLKSTRKLTSELRKLPEGSDAFMRKAKQLKGVKNEFNRVKQEIYGVRGELNKSSSAVGRFFNRFTQGGLLMQNALGFLTAGALVYKAKKTGDELIRIADAITDVEKTSGLATEQVRELWNELSNVDSRTDKLDMMSIATIGGRLGIKDKNELFEFTKGVDKAYVSLGDSFEGGLEAVTTKLGKMKNIFAETKELDYATAINQIGSALNELAAEGTSSEDNISDFALRVGQLPAALKPAADKILGLGAAMEESGIDARVASSGYSRFMLSAAKNIDAFAYSMQMGLDEAKELLNTHPEEFFLQFAQGMQGLDATTTANIFKELKLDTQEIQKAVGAAGQNADRFREMMKLSGEAMKEATSLSEEFLKKNSNSAAIWQKMKKGFDDFLTGNVVGGAFNKLTNLLGAITGVTSDAATGTKVFANRLAFLFKTIAVGTTAVLSYRAAVWLSAKATADAYQKTLLYNVVQGVTNAKTKIATASTLLYSAAKQALKGNINGATFAMKRFNVVTKMNPLGLLISLLGTAITAWQLFKTRTKEASETQNALSNSTASANKEIASQKNELQELLAVARDRNQSLENQQKAVDELNRLVPEYNNNLTIESAKTEAAKKTLDEYINSLVQAARVKHLKMLVDKKAEEVAAAEDVNLEDQVKWYQRLWLQIKSGGNAYKYINDYTIAAVKNKKKLVDATREELKTLNELHEKEKSKLKPAHSTDNSIHQNLMPTGSTTDKTLNRELSSGLKDAIKAREDAEKKKLEVISEYQESEIDLMQEGKEKEIEQIKSATSEKINAIKSENEKLLREVDEAEQAIFDLRERLRTGQLTQSEKAEIQASIKAYDKVMDAKMDMIQTNAAIEKNIIERQKREIAIINEKYELKSYEQEVKEAQRRIKLYELHRESEISNIKTLADAKLEIRDNEFKKLSDQEISEIKSLEDAKKILREEANRKVLKMTLDNLEIQKSALEEMLKSLSGPAAEKLLADLEKLNDKIKQIKNNLQGKTASDEAESNANRNSELDQVDVLGFSAAQWNSTFENLETTKQKVEAIGMVFSALSNAAKLFAEHQKNLNDKELLWFEKNQKKKKDALLKQLDAGLISQEQYHNRMIEFDEAAAAKKRELELKQAKADKATRMFDIIGATAVAVAKALPNIPLSVLVGSLGAAELAVVANQKLPSYYQGGFTKSLGYKDGSGHEVAGFAHANEYYIPEWLLKQPEVAQVAQWLEAKRTGVTQSFADGGYTTETRSIGSASNQNNNELYLELITVINQLSNHLIELKEDGLDAFVIADAQNGKKLHNAIKQYRKLNDKNKR